jgi:hypothetical protein
VTASTLGCPETVDRTGEATEMADVPKSHIFKLPFDITKLALLMSQWITPCRCKYNTAEAASLAHFHRVLHKISLKTFNTININKNYFKKKKI